MKKVSLALIAAISMLGSVAHADEGKATGGTGAGGATGAITAGTVAVGAVIAGAVVASNSADGNPITTTSNSGK